MIEITKWSRSKTKFYSRKGRKVKGEAYRREIECPFCGREFEGHEFEDGQCPQCGEAYSWDTVWEDGYDPEEILVEWEREKGA